MNDFKKKKTSPTHLIKKFNSSVFFSLNFIVLGSKTKFKS